MASPENNKKYVPQFEPDQNLVNKNGKYNGELIDNEPGPPGSSLGKYYCRLMLGKYTRTRPFEPETWEPNKSIILPLPQEMFDESIANYSDINLETIGNLLNQDAVTGLGSIALRQSGSILSGTINAGAAAAFGKIGSKIAGTLTKGAGITPEKITSAIQQSIGVAPNPNPSVQFTGPALREFLFSWVFYPRTPDESLRIDNMIRQLKSSALPSHTFTNSTAILNYPDLCQLNFFPWDSGGSSNGWGWTNGSIIRIKKCFIKNVRVNYSDQGVPAFFHGTQLPIMYRLNLSFQETEYMLSKDWGGNEWSNLVTDSDVANYLIDKGFQPVINAIAPGSGALIDIFQTAVLGNEDQPQ